MLRTNNAGFVNHDADEPAPALTTREARQGVTSGRVRAVLVTSLLLALAVFAVLYVTMIR